MCLELRPARDRDMVTQTRDHATHLRLTQHGVTLTQTRRYLASFMGASAMPHLGHLPGLSDFTSGCIGQV
jgi:hypothetical protein